MIEFASKDNQIHNTLVFDTMLEKFLDQKFKLVNRYRLKNFIKDKSQQIPRVKNGFKR